MPGLARTFRAFMQRPGAATLRAPLAALGAALALWVCTAGSALALDLVVDTFGDSAAAGFRACTEAAGDCTLRGAILRANAVPGPHTITLPAGTYTISIVAASDDPGLTGDLDIAQTVTINGVGADSTVITWDESISPNDRERIFDVFSTGSLTLRDMSLRRGGWRPTITAGPGPGGAIASSGSLTVERVSIRLSEATMGGGLYVTGNTIIRDSAIVLNNGAFGSGLYVGGGSAITVSIENSTISGNSATDHGGGLYNASTNVNTVVTLNNVTVANNSATTAGGLIRVGTGTLVLRNTIVANNTAPSNPNCFGAIASQGHNLVFGGDTCGMSAGIGDIVNTGGPVLGPLQLNGGPTVTHALGSGSAALDRGNPATPGSGGNACTAADQRGLPRTLDGDGDGIPRCDIGAVEGGRWLAVDTTTDSNAVGFRVCDTDLTNANCSLRGAVTLANAAGVPIASVITLPATGPGNPYRLTETGAGEDANVTGDLDVSNDITIVGGGATTAIVDGNQTDGIFHVISGPSTALRLQDLTVQNGSASARPGGGIYASNPVHLLRVRVRSSSSGLTGGGISVDGGTGSTIADSTISENVAPTGGGIHHQGAQTLTLANTTVSSNQATGAGAGAGILANAGGIVLANATVAGNSGGTGVHINAAQLTARNTIIAGNASSNCGGTGLFTSQGFNLVFGGGTCGFTQGSDRQNQNPQLQPLTLNGGTTETMALGGGSAAIDAGNTAAPGSGGTACAAADQRGTPRPVDGDTVGGPRCDIGAYEAAVCTTRPNVALGVAPGTPGRIQVTVTAGTGTITELRLHALPQTNVQVSIGALVNQSGELTVPINAPTAQFTMRRANGTGAGTLPFDVVDGCGVWKTLAGGGPNAWLSGPSAASEENAPQPPSDPSSPPAGQAGVGVPAPSPGCSPRRPEVGLVTTRRAPGQLQSVLSAQALPGASPNSLHRVRIATISRAAVTLNGAPVVAGQTVELAPGARQATLVVERLADGAERDDTSGVAFVVTDDCGEWHTFVGGGPSGF